MKEKDLAERHLEVYEDVFADIVNVLLFKGINIVKGKELETAVTQSTYKASGKLRGQERDVAKYINSANIHVAFLGIENQTDVDRDMPLRIMSYDGAAYRAQLLREEQRIRYPVITLVLYFGYERRWNKPVNLLECLDIPQELLPYVNDYRINVFEIAYLSEEQISMFQSDFRVIADYFLQMRKNNDYIPSSIPMQHVYETMELLSVLTKDQRFVRACEEEQEGGMTMCEVLDRVETRGFKKGERRGKKAGRYEMLKELVSDGVISLAEAAKRINMSEEAFLKRMN